MAGVGHERERVVVPPGVGSQPQFSFRKCYIRYLKTNIVQVEVIPRACEASLTNRCFEVDRGDVNDVAKEQKRKDGKSV